MRYLNKINYELIDYLLTLIINAIIFSMTENKDEANEYQKIFRTILPLEIIQTII